MKQKQAVRAPAKKWLTKCIASALMFAGVAGPAGAATFSVTSCSDSDVGDTSTGTLRAEVTLANAAATAISDDSVDLTACKASTITLTHGAIAVTAPSLHIGAQTGATGGATIYQESHDRIFNHTGAGTLEVKYAHLEAGYFATGDTAFGGCIYSAGTVLMNHSTADACVAYTTGNFAAGGAIYALAGVTLRESVVSNSYARSTAKSRGGGVATTGNLQIVYSTVTGNRAGGAPGTQGYGGGVFGSDSTTIDNSTLDNNYAQTSGGAFALAESSASRGAAVISNSTISGNVAHTRGGVSYIENVNVGIYNSTVAFNSAGRFGTGKFGGLYVYGFSTLIVQSSIFANNSDTSATAHDLYINYSRNGAISSGSSNNLARSTNVQTPGIIVSSSDPLIAPLANHGGLTRTHALLAGSPAINLGNDDSSLAIDQRGNGFPRVVGAGADIGAYERQAVDDEIFYAGLESDIEQFLPSIIEIGTGFTMPTGVAVDSHGNVFVADRQNSAVKEILASNGSTVTVGSGFSIPFSVAVDQHGDVFVADTFNNAIKEIVAVNGSIPPTPTIRTLAASFNFPCGVAVDAAGNVFVADTSNNAIKELIALNGSIPASPTIVTLGSGFNNPFGVAVDHNDNVYVADTVNGKIKELLATGGYTTTTAIGTGFVRPYGVFVDASGNVFVADSTTNKISKISADHSTTTVVGGAFNAPNGVTSDASGNVFVADSANNVVKEVINR